MRSGRCFRPFLILLLLLHRAASRMSRTDTFYTIKWTTTGDSIITVEGQFREYGAVRVAKIKLHQLQEDWCPLGIEILRDTRFSFQKAWTEEERAQFEAQLKADGCLDNSKKKGFKMVETDEKIEREQSKVEDEEEPGSTTAMIAFLVTGPGAVVIIAAFIAVFVIMCRRSKTQAPPKDELRSRVESKSTSEAEAKRSEAESDCE
ncbi:hypothetical protein L596_019369 [Steinernema carpocapsae]|uniref:Uncharacterized protein n=1 Tax=Steinernema carpocapsae TaxID=34508 RepID=A0A4U5MQG4_STECR|nr:hypothetical protein L596_019369 [Steinernema carpocapsae]